MVINNNHYLEYWPISCANMGSASYSQMQFEKRLSKVLSQKLVRYGRSFVQGRKRLQSCRTLRNFYSILSKRCTQNSTATFLVLKSLQYQWPNRGSTSSDSAQPR
ncbi:hypothetical protein CEXT_657601 [Caerostris extrusa]|uniref:Uncharacterized protein n=1 Tax=Caerostris extrusa TaxID=172846 RepID=A0AAV4M2L5_CAEEX|nr:hypothetical protein CEXT_657601 [Caerostris extrusa]